MKHQKPYKLEKVKSGKYVVISKDYKGFDNILPELSQDLKSRNVNGDVVLDLLLSNGNNNRRFYQVHFNGEFRLDTIRPIIYPGDEIIEKVNSFFKKNQSILNNGVLSTAEIKRILATIN